MAEQEHLMLEKIVHAAQREHAAVQYPGDLAADLGLTCDSPRGWLKRWRPAIALCAVITLAAGGVGLWALLGPSPDTPSPPMAEVEPEPSAPISPGPLVAQHHNEPGSAANSPAVMTREQFAAVKQHIADLRASAKRTASVRLAQIIAENRKMKTSVSLRPLSPSAVGLAAMPHPAFSTPSGLSMPAYSPSFTKEMS